MTQKGEREALFLTRACQGFRIVHRTDVATRALHVDSLRIAQGSRDDEMASFCNGQRVNGSEFVTVDLPIEERAFTFLSASNKVHGPSQVGKRRYSLISFYNCLLSMHRPWLRTRYNFCVWVAGFRGQNVTGLGGLREHDTSASILPSPVKRYRACQDFAGCGRALEPPKLEYTYPVIWISKRAHVGRSIGVIVPERKNSPRVGERSHIR